MCKLDTSLVSMGRGVSDFSIFQSLAFSPSLLITQLRLQRHFHPPLL